MILSTLCLRPEYHKKVRAVAAMAPGVYGHDFKTSTVKFGVPLVARAVIFWRIPNSRTMKR